jgi:hypothetical protein
MTAPAGVGEEAPVARAADVAPVAHDADNAPDGRPREAEPKPQHP